jgi:hypothetical protein
MIFGAQITCGCLPTFFGSVIISSEADVSTSIDASRMITGEETLKQARRFRALWSEMRPETSPGCTGGFSQNVWKTV